MPYAVQKLQILQKTIIVGKQTTLKQEICCIATIYKRFLNVGFPLVCYEYVLLPFVNKEAPLAYGRTEYG